MPTSQSVGGALAEIAASTLDELVEASGWIELRAGDTLSARHVAKALVAINSQTQCQPPITMDEEASLAASTDVPSLPSLPSLPALPAPDKFAAGVRLGLRRAVPATPLPSMVNMATFFDAAAAVAVAAATSGADDDTSFGPSLAHFVFILQSGLVTLHATSDAGLHASQSIGCEHPFRLADKTSPCPHPSAGGPESMMTSSTPPPAPEPEQASATSTATIPPGPPLHAAAVCTSPVAHVLVVPVATLEALVPDWWTSRPARS